MTRLTALFCSLLLLWQPASWAQDLPFTLSADDVRYNLKENVVNATGDVDIIGNDHRLRANNIIFNPETDDLTATGDVTFMLPDGTILFVESIDLNGEFKSGIIEALRLRLGPTGARMTAARAERKADGRMVFTNAKYTPCTDTCSNDSELPWYVQAAEITYTPSTSALHYDDPQLVAFGRGLVKLPWFSHTIGPRQGRSGLLPPRFGSSGNHGLEVETAYYYHKADNEDVTLRARAMSERGLMLKGQHRLQGEHWRSEINGSMIDDDQSGDFRSHVDINSVYVLQPGRRVGFTGAALSDETYLDDFFNETPAYLGRTAYAEDASAEHYVVAQATHYQDLRNGADNNETAQVLPQVQAERVVQLGERGSQLRLFGDAQALHRDEGARTQRLIGQASYHKPIELAHGQRVEVEAKLRTDAYHLDGTTDDGWTGRVLPQVSIDWQKPMISPNGRHLVTPRAQLVLSPRGGTPDEIPNDDSVAYELDVTNLFNSNRFAGLDRVETGPRFIYGVDQRWGSAEQEKARLFVGQSIQWFNDADLPELGGTGTKSSDWVALLRLRPNKNLSLSQQVRLDNADLVTRRADTNITVGDTETNYFQTTYSYLDAGPSELTLRGQFSPHPKWQYYAEMRRDLTDGGKQLLLHHELKYTHNCYRAGIAVRRRGFRNRTVPPATDILFNVDLLTFGNSDY